MTSIPTALRPSLSRAILSIGPCTSKSCSHNLQQTRHATLIRRPKRPYTFTQLVMLTDGSAFLHRTTSPVPVYRSNKDINTAPLWNPSSEKLMNVEEDEAGKLSAFRSRFGRNWDQTGKKMEEANESEKDSQKSQSKIENEDQGLDSLMDLIAGSATNIPAPKLVSKKKKK